LRLLQSDRLALMAKRRAKSEGAEHPGGFNIETLKKYALAGAAITLAKLREEIRIIERTFPELASAKGRQKIVAGIEDKASRMSTAGRAEVSKRMKRYWAARRRAEARKKG
jgi:hypothetical protein